MLLVACSVPQNGPSKCDSDYVRIIAKDLQRGKYLTAVNATYNQETFKIIVDSFELQQLLEGSGISSDTTILKELIRGERPVELNINNLDRISIVRKWREIDNVLANGKDSTLQYFFRGAIQKVPLTSSERDYLISILAGWCLLVYVDDETGYIKIMTTDKYRSVYGI